MKEGRGSSTTATTYMFMTLLVRPKMRVHGSPAASTRPRNVDAFGFKDVMLKARSAHLPASFRNTQHEMKSAYHRPAAKIIIRAGIFGSVCGDGWNVLCAKLE